MLICTICLTCTYKDKMTRHINSCGCVIGTTPANLKLPLINHTSCDTCHLVFICTCETYGTYKHRWFSGRMLACHAGGPGSIRYYFCFHSSFNKVVLSRFD
jgi:hypothetical protein